MVIVDEVDRTEGTVLLDLTHHAPNAVTVVGVILDRQADAIVGGSQQSLSSFHSPLSSFLSSLSSFHSPLSTLLSPLSSKQVPPHPLVHDGLQVVGSRKILSGLRPPLRHRILRKQLHRVCPRIAVFRGLQHRLAGGLMLMAGVCQVVHIEPSVPVGHHRLVVVGPGLCPSHGLDGMYPHHGLQSSVVSCRTGNGRTAVVYHVAVVFDESLHQLFVSHEHRSVLMAYRETHGSRLVLERLEVLGAMGSVNLVTVAVVVDVPPVAHLSR